MEETKKIKLIKEPKISIITASYNYQDLIITAIDSIINQTYKNWELIIVDDGSSDNSVEVIKKYVEKYDNIFLFQHENGINKGLKDTVKLGVEKCSSDYIAFLEADDYWREDCLEKRVAVINKHPEVGFIFNDVELFGDEESVKTFDKYFKKNKITLQKSFWPNKVCIYFSVINIVPTFSCVTLKKEILERCSFETPYDPWLDWWLYAQIACFTKLYFIDEKLTFWKRHAQSYLAKTDKKLKLKKKHIKFRFQLIDMQQKYIKNHFDLFLLSCIKNSSIEKFCRGLIRKYLRIRYGGLSLF